MQVFIPYKLIHQYYGDKGGIVPQFAMVDFTQLQFYFEEYLAGKMVMELTCQGVKDALKNIHDSRGRLRYRVDRTVDKSDLTLIVDYLLPAIVDIINTNMREYLNYWFIENRYNGVMVYLIRAIRGENLALTHSLPNT